MLMAIPYFMLYVFYVLITLEQRNEYMSAQAKGMHCVGSKDSSFIITGSARTYYFDPNQKPRRNYRTWREFWTVRGYYKAD